MALGSGHRLAVPVWRVRPGGELLRTGGGHHVCGPLSPAAAYWRQRVRVGCPYAVDGGAGVALHRRAAARGHAVLPGGLPEWPAALSRRQRTPPVVAAA